jgi:hypothetical protein
MFGPIQMLFHAPGGSEKNKGRNDIFALSMETLKDILVNLLSDAIWALGGFLFARLLLFKKNLLGLTNETSSEHSKKSPFMWINCV